MPRVRLSKEGTIAVRGQHGCVFVARHEKRGMVQVSVYPDGHEKTDGLQMKRAPNSRASKRIERWKGTKRR